MPSDLPALEGVYGYWEKARAVSLGRKPDAALAESLYLDYRGERWAAGIRAAVQASDAIQLNALAAEMTDWLEARPSAGAPGELAYARHKPLQPAELCFQTALAYQKLGDLSAARAHLRRVEQGNPSALRSVNQSIRWPQAGRAFLTLFLACLEGSLGQPAEALRHLALAKEQVYDLARSRANYPAAPVYQDLLQQIERLQKDWRAVPDAPPPLAAELAPEPPAPVLKAGPLSLQWISSFPGSPDDSTAGAKYTLTIHRVLVQSVPYTLHRLGDREVYDLNEPGELALVTVPTTGPWTRLDLFDQGAADLAENELLLVRLASQAETWAENELMVYPALNKKERRYRMGVYRSKEDNDARPPWGRVVGKLIPVEASAIWAMERDRSLNQAASLHLPLATCLRLGPSDKPVEDALRKVKLIEVVYVQVDDQMMAVYPLAGCANMRLQELSRQAILRVTSDCMSAYGVAPNDFIWLERNEKPEPRRLVAAQARPDDLKDCDLENAYTFREYLYRAPNRDAKDGQDAAYNIELRPHSRTSTHPTRYFRTEEKLVDLLGVARLRLGPPA